MKKFTAVRTAVTPLDRANVDTDQIIPKQFLKLIQRSGFGGYLFHDWRFLPGGRPDPDFVLNDPAYSGSRILAAGENFGCGSSREHAVWALRDYGFDVVVAPSFADIFYGNCFKNGILPVRLPPQTVRRIQGTRRPVGVDLEAQTVVLPGGDGTGGDDDNGGDGTGDDNGGDGQTVPFEIDPYKKRILLEGLDDISLTLQYEGEISRFEDRSQIPSAL